MQKKGKNALKKSKKASEKLEKSSSLEDKIAKDSSHSELLAWCQSWHNKISIYDPKAEQEYAEFNGAPLTGMGDRFVNYARNNWTHVKEVSNTKLLVSLHQGKRSAKMEFFDTSKKGKARRVYSFEETFGDVGYGDVTYNARRGFLGAIPVGSRITYHLFNIGSEGLMGDFDVKLLRKTKWNLLNDTSTNSSFNAAAERVNYMISFDFDPNGEAVAAIDRYGMCTISDIATNRLCLQKKLDRIENESILCRWSSKTDEPLLFLKFNSKCLNILDVEKNCFTLWNNLKENYFNSDIYWIDVCPNDSNLVACGGRCPLIYDRRMSKVATVIRGAGIYDSYSGKITCVRWNANGSMLASSATESTVKLIDFKTSKLIFQGTTQDDGIFLFK